MIPRVCIIGVGSIAKAAHGPALQRLQHEGIATLCGCAGISMEEAQPFAERFGFKHAYSNYVQMLDEEKPDLTFCLLPIKKNASAAICVMKKGGYAVMEKPPGANLDETYAIINAEKETEKRCAILFNRRSMPLLRELKSLLQTSGEQVEAVGLEMTRSARINEDFTTTAVHGVDCLRYLIGDFDCLTFDYQNHQKEGYVNFFAAGTMAGNVHVDMKFLPNTGGVTERINVYTDHSQYSLHMPMWNGITYAAGPDTPGQLTVISEEKISYTVNGDKLSESSEGYVLNGFYDEDKLILENYKNLPNNFSIQSAIQSIEITDKMRKQILTFRKG